MPLLEAFLALALTLLSLAMIATLIVEMIHRIAGTRSEDLKKMLGELYERELRNRELRECDPREMIESLLKKRSDKLGREVDIEEMLKELLKNGSKKLRKDKRKLIEQTANKLLKESNEESEGHEHNPKEMVASPPEMVASPPEIVASPPKESIEGPEGRSRKLKEAVTNLLKKSGKQLKDGERVLKEVIEAELKDDFINALICNPLKKRATGGRLRDLLGRIPGIPLIGRIPDRLHIRGPANRKNLVSLPPEDLFKRLASTDIGKQIKKKAEAEIDEAVDRLSQSFDEIGAAATDMFRRGAQIVSLFVGVVVAFAFNADAIRIYKAYLDDPKTRATAIARADTALESFANETNEPDGYNSRKEFREDVNSLRIKIKELGDMDLPIGYSEDSPPLSWLLGDSNSDPKKQIAKPKSMLGWAKLIKKKWQDPEAMPWALSVFGTGLLIGLGGPFWFNVVRKLTDVLQVVRGGAPVAAGAGTTAGAGGRAAVPADPLKRNRDAFKMTGGLPETMEAQARLTAASKAVKDAADVLEETQDARRRFKGQKDEGGLMKAAVEQAKESLRTAIEEQREAQRKVVAAQKTAHGPKEETQNATESSNSAIDDNNEEREDAG